MPTSAGQAQRSQTPWAGASLLLAGGLLIFGAAAHLLYLLHDCPLDLSGDEAHYWEWSRRLDLSYYSKGPLVAYVIAGGRLLLAELSERWLGNETLAVRGPAILLSILTGLGVFTLALRTLRSGRQALAAVALTFTMPILAVGAMLMTIDAPLACCSVWTLVFAHHGLRSGRLWPWLIVGTLIALGVLAKYTMVLLFPAVGLALLDAPSYRHNLRRPGPYIATALGLLGFVPILIWNAQHDWVSFRHVAGQAGVSDSSGFQPLGPLVYLAGQAAVINPIWFVGMMLALVHVGRRRARAGDATIDAEASRRLLLWAAVVPWAVFLLFSLITKVQPNWPVLAVFPGTILLVHWLSALLNSARRAARGLILGGTIVGVVMVVVMHNTAWLMPVFGWLARGAPPWELTPVARYDPAARLRGWSPIGVAVGDVLRAERAAGRDPFLVTDDYQLASLVAFYCPGEPVVYCLQAALGERQSQYDVWHNPIDDEADFMGRPCIYVGAAKPVLFGDGVENAAVLPNATRVRTVEHRVRGQLLRVRSIYTCSAYAGLPPTLRAAVTERY